MKLYSNKTHWYVFAVLLTIAAVVACENNVTTQSPKETGSEIAASKTNSPTVQAKGASGTIKDEYIVAFKERWQNVRNRQVADQVQTFTDRFLEEEEIPADSVISRFQFALRGFTARMDAGKAEALRQNPQVEFVEQNRRFTAINSPSVADTTGYSTMSSQTGPWGILRVGGPFDGSYKRAWILDSGIDLDHPDLNVDVTNSESFIAGENADDLTGHGTHVAGILAAKNNNRDVVGVAAGASVVSVKVFDQFGGSNDNIICNGIEHVMQNASTNDVVNMSLSAHDPNGNRQAVDTCVENAADMGYRVVISAGNTALSADEFTPARVEHGNVWTVSAFRQGGEFIQNFDPNTPNCDDPSLVGSNHGNPPIEFAAPGENIVSLWRDGGTFTTCGTSMAAPHVAGLLLACGEAGLETDGSVSNDPATPSDPIAWGYKAGVPSNVTHSVVQSSYDPNYFNPKLDWDPVSGATEYEIRRKHWQGSWKVWTTTSSTSYTDYMTNSESLQAVSYQPSQYWVAYNIRAVNECGAGSWPISPKYFKFDSDDSIPMFMEPSTK